jgi:hypothetical protein
MVRTLDRVVLRVVVVAIAVPSCAGASSAAARMEIPEMTMAPSYGFSELCESHPRDPSVDRSSDDPEETEAPPLWGPFLPVALAILPFLPLTAHKFDSLPFAPGSQLGRGSARPEGL